MIENGKNIKPLGKPSYGSIPHLPSSRLGPGDHYISEGQAKICTEKTRDRHDVVIVQEKLDGSNVGVAKINGKVIAITRAGYLATDSPHLQHHYFDRYVKEHYKTFDLALYEDERLCGEWLAMAHGTRYNLPHSPFVVFDLIKAGSGQKSNLNRAPYDEFKHRCQSFDLDMPNLLSMPNPVSIEAAKELVKQSAHGAIDPVEGVIYRVERKGAVDFLAKFVQHHKQDGKYSAENNEGRTVWNFDISKWEKVNECSK
jgi:hypothetical protein